MMSKNGHFPRKLKKSKLANWPNYVTQQHHWLSCKITMHTELQNVKNIFPFLGHFIWREKIFFLINFIKAFYKSKSLFLKLWMAILMIYIHSIKYCTLFSFITHHVWVHSYIRTCPECSRLCRNFAVALLRLHFLTVFQEAA